MKTKLLFLFFLISTASIAQSYNGPESVVYDSVNKRYFISNNGANQILARDSSGTLTVFTSNISSGPHGLEIVDTVLYACDGSSMKGFGLTSASLVMNLNVGATFLNGICTDGSNYINTTDFTAKKIFKINIAAQTFTTFCTGLAKSPNGIIYDATNQRIIWVTWGTNAPIMQALLTDSVVSQVTATTLGNCDGIDRDGSGRYYVSAWNTQSIYRFNNLFATTPVAVVTGLSSPADIYYNLTNDSLVSPNAGNNTVTFHYMGVASSIEENSRNTFSIYPNPASAQLKMENGELKISSIEIYDMMGQICLTPTLSKEEGVAASINISELTAGIYFVKISGEKETRVERFVKE